MEKVISYSTKSYKSIKWNKLREFTIHECFNDFRENEYQWEKVKEIHIIGTIVDSSNDLLENNKLISEEMFGVYYNEDKSWVLIVGNQVEKYTVFLERCNQLELLDCRFTKVDTLVLKNLERVKKLYLYNNEKLNELIGLNLLQNLNSLNLNFTSITELPNSIFTRNLIKLSIRSTKISNLSGVEFAENLRYLDIALTPIMDCSVISNLRFLEQVNLNCTDISELPELNKLYNLEYLNCSFSPITTLPQIDNLNKLRSLNIGHTNISTLEGIDFPDNLRNLSLEGTDIRRITSNITSLTNLRKLNLSNIKLDTMPSDILKLNLEFNLVNKGWGIYLYETYIKDMDMSLFEQPREIIEAWYYENDKNLNNGEISNPLNEAKVVFLGDGGAGKSLTIERLLSDGKKPKSFDGDSTPGIAISSYTYKIDGKDILVHFWDFGGQEIMHSMHRMFLTTRTLYVVLLNARDNTQDARARYWLHNIKSFADGSPILLVLNQMDQNPSASVNEPALRELYPSLTQIVKISAVNFSVDQFNSILMKSLLCEINNMKYIEQPFLNSWNRLKKSLQNMKKYYIDSAEFKKMSEECGVTLEDDVRSMLLDWFGDLGISFCYRESSVLSNYMVLRPDWITNAIYIILFNGSNRAQNGLIKYEDIHELLRIPECGESLSKRVLKDVTYSTTEIEYVLGVIRKFRLSYRINDDMEFIPMLCDRNENEIAKKFVRDDTLEFRMEYTYLPTNVLHRLMVEMRNDLVYEYVWLTGAVFASNLMELEALVKEEDNILQIYVKSKSKLYSANVYLGLIRSVLDNINEDIGLETKEIIVYKQDGTSDEFEYDYLIDSYQHGNTTVYSSVLKRNISILDILNQVDGDIQKAKKELIQDMVDACGIMQSNKIYWQTDEDSRNTCIRNLLREKGYMVSDQTFNGKSQTGKKAGELDLMIMETSSRPLAIFEALNLNSFASTGKEYWKNHLTKLLDNYDPMGLPFSFLVSYVECPKDQFTSFWTSYYNYLSYNCDSKYSIQKVQDGVINIKSYGYLRLAECVYDRAGIPTIVYHICIRLGE